MNADKSFAIFLWSLAASCVSCVVLACMGRTEVGLILLAFTLFFWVMAGLIVLGVAAWRGKL